MAMAPDALRSILLTTMQEEDPKLFRKLRATKELNLVVKEQIKQAKEVFDLTLRSIRNPSETDRIMARDLAQQRLLDYPQKPVDLIDPTLIDPADEIWREQTFDSLAPRTR